MSFELPQTYTFSLCIDRGDRTIVDTTVEVQATAGEIAKAKKTIQRLMNEYVPVPKTPASTPELQETGLEDRVAADPAASPEAEAREGAVKRQQDGQPLKEAPAQAGSASDKPPDGAKGLLQLHCGECGRTFGTYLREFQSAFVCRCGHRIDLTAPLARYRFTCPYCGKETWGQTNLEDPEITVRCKCGGDVDLRWVPKAREYQN